MKLNIRDVKAEDTISIVKLAKELGYNISNKEIKYKIQKFSSIKTEKIFIAEYDKVVGWIHISIVDPLESMKFLEIRGIVVFKEYRNRGIGTNLIEHAEQWAKVNKIKKIRVRTNIIREKTQQYYNNLSFKLLKTQAVFEKMI